MQPTGSGDRRLDIAIVGGGASGTLTAVQLLAHATAREIPVDITLIDEHGRHGLGLAYSTTHPGHLLNAMARQMSALPDDPDHLVRWAAASLAPDSTPSASTFLPRHAYGQYLRDTLAAAEAAAGQDSRLSRINSQAVAINRAGVAGPLQVVLTDGEVRADVVVLATGNAASEFPFATPASDRIIADPWLPGALDALGDGAQVVIVGTGLTMIDLAIAITSASPATRVHAVSRHGLLPRAHPGDSAAVLRPMWLPVISRTTGPVRLGELMWQIRQAVSANPANWPAVMESLRPYVPGLWRRMPAQDKRLFLRHVARYWEVHRHLVPPATASRITALRCTGQLSVHRGRVLSVRDVSGRLSVLIDAGADVLDIAAGAVVNGTGATADITTTANPLLRHLFATGMARPDPLRLGIDATAQGAVVGGAGVPSDAIYTLGPPLRGLWYETTAVPEIREQAAALARRITAQHGLSRRSGSAA
jgi:uncharacterized NAD(P)/FAD-binding protein YdhS